MFWNRKKAKAVGVNDAIRNGERIEKELHDSRIKLCNRIVKAINGEILSSRAPKDGVYTIGMDKLYPLKKEKIGSSNRLKIGIYKDEVFNDAMKDALEEFRKAGWVVNDSGLGYLWFKIHNQQSKES